MPESLTFTAFVLSLASTAAIHFGDLPDPVSGEISEPNLDGAAQMIDILTLLEEKTRGNLTAEERQLLEQLLYELRIRYVEATQTPGDDRDNTAGGNRGATPGGKLIIEP
ncbi:MAG TPA: DUF1844 domain-containing protein [Vicinamibacterales bacterium]|jgi:hypothetical protein|nr:DUF1844 domain-containing protein [Vicinamibacterales bacterium]